MAGMSDDILRQLANLIRFGTVQSVAGKHIRVQIGGLLTRPIRWVSARAGKTASWSPPDLGEQVMVLSPNGDIGAAVAIGGIFCDANDIPEAATADTVLIAFRDGAVLLYDQGIHLLKGTLPDGGRVEITAPAGFKFSGNVDIDGTFKVSQAATFEQTLHAKQDITSDADVKAGTISLTNHPHGLVKGGTDTSGKPLP
jgi:phage baseplate assembly protein V